jgi:hypothetical protein
LKLYLKSMNLSVEQVNALAPDSSSLKAGRDLAILSKWQLRGASDKALWGHCQGSSKLPYQTQIDTINIAFKCNCPSRKFPCKHGLGLLLLYIAQPASFTKEGEPDWVSDWLDKRTEKIEKKAEQKAEQKDKPVDLEAQAKRAEARIKKVTDGAEELQTWVKDLVHNGLMNVPERAYDFWQSPAKRMIDAQAGGLAGMVKGLGTINFYADSWKYDLLSRLTRIYTIAESFKHLNNLPEEYATEVKTIIGFNQAKDDVLARTGVQDDWLVLSRIYVEEDQVTTERNWLYGSKTGRFALILQFIVKGQIPELNLMPGTSINAELAFYNGAKVYRALVKLQTQTGGLVPVNDEPDLASAFQNFSSVISANPFYERVPVVVNNLRLIKSGRNLYLSDADSKAVIANCSADVEIKLLALTGGTPCKIFMLLNEVDATPMAVWLNNKFYSFGNAVEK